MSFEDFQHLARMSVVGALELGELAQFEEGRNIYGELAEDYLRDCRRLEAAFALGLRPAPLRADAKDRLLTAIRGRVRR